MSLHSDIKNQIKEAMLGRDTIRLSVVRGLVASFTNELVAKSRKPTEELSDADVITVLKRLAKQRKDSVEQFRKGGREDLAKAEESELKILEEFLPMQMSEKEIRKIAEMVKMKLAIVDKSKMGQFIGAVMKETSGRADGTMVKSVVEKLFS